MGKAFVNVAVRGNIVNNLKHQKLLGKTLRSRQGPNNYVDNSQDLVNLSECDLATVIL